MEHIQESIPPQFLGLNEEVGDAFDLIRREANLVRQSIIPSMILDKKPN